MLIVDVMTRNPQTIAPEDPIQDAARLMDELNVGVLPVCDGAQLVGVLTDRDIVVRSTAAGQDPTTCTVAGVMTKDVTYCFADTPVEEALEQMEGLQIRRMPVVDGDRRLVGIVSLGDFAAEDEALAGEALAMISNPSRPDR